MLIKTVIEEIETSHLKVGLQLLQNLPKMPEKSYVNLIIKLSLNKIRHILMDRNFYIFLWTKAWSSTPTLKNQLTFPQSMSIFAWENSISHWNAFCSWFSFSPAAWFSNKLWASLQLILSMISSVKRLFCNLWKKQKGHASFRNLIVRLSGVQKIRIFC